MAIQPGVGYTFTASSQGENINVIQPWSNIALLHEPEVLQFEVRPYSGVATNVAAIQIREGRGQLRPEQYARGLGESRDEPLAGIHHEACRRFRRNLGDRRRHLA